MSENENENKMILYILIGSGSKPLAGYSHLKGDFIQACESQLSQCKKNQSAAVSYGDYKICYENTENITYLIMIGSAYPMAAVVSCIESLKKEFADFLRDKNFASIENYGLNKDMQKKLKEKFEYFNENTHLVSEKIEQLKNSMASYKDEVFRAADSLNLREDLLNDMNERAENMANESLTYKLGAIKVKKLECGKKAWTIIGIIIVVLIIAGVVLPLCLS